MLKAISHRWRSSFRFKLIFATVVLITLTVAIYSGLLYWHHAHASEAGQKERAARLASLLAESLALPMYEFNTLAVEAGVKALESHADVRRVRVSDSSGKVIVERSNADQHGEVLLTIQQSIFYKTVKRNLPVGTIELAFSRVGLDAELYNALFDTVIGGVLMAFATVMATLWAFSSLTRPLSEITTGLDQLAAGQTDISLPTLGRSDEFGRMTTAMHRFRDAIVRQRQAELTVRETEQRYREELEGTVAQRTVQLEEAKEVAEKANRAKSSFVANMSHEIRTPLNAVLGLAKIIVREDQGRKSSQTATRILEAGEHLLGVINDILDFSKIEAGKMLINPQPFDLAACINKATDLVSDKADLKRLSFKVHLSPELPAWVSGDQLRLEQILINLLSNAVKFTERGEVSLSVTRESERVIFRIVDTGIGMNAEQLMRLFRPFEQADGTTTRKFGGTGLGLAISRSLANQMGGDIAVESVIGVGSSFALSLPLAHVSAEKHVVTLPVDGPRLGGIRVLAAEDVELNRYVLEDLLVNEGATVKFAKNGREALDLINKHGVSAFDMVLTDIQMPVMDGYELARTVAKKYPTLAVIGLTAHAMTEERDRCLAAGMVAHVTKPIDEDVLISAILQCCNLPRQDARPAVPITQANIAHDVLDAKQLIHWDELMRRYKGRIAFVEKLVGTLLRTHSDTPQKLRDAVHRNDFETAKFLTHSIKGISGSLEARSLYALAQVIDEGDNNPANLHGMMMKLADALDELLQMLRQRSALKETDPLATFIPETTGTKLN